MLSLVLNHTTRNRGKNLRRIKKGCDPCRTTIKMQLHPASPQTALRLLTSAFALSCCAYIITWPQALA